MGWKQIDVGTVGFYSKLARIIFSIQNHFDVCNLCMQFYKLFELVRNTIINIILQLNLIKINMILKTKWLLSLLPTHLDIYIYIG